MEDNPIWSVENNHGDQWRAGAVTIVENDDFQVKNSRKFALN